MRKKKFFLNTLAAIFNQIIVIVCGFILPRQILLYYGSDVNGIISSITNFLGFIALLDFGVGSVVQAALYKPLSQKKDVEIGNILYESKKFFNKIGFFLILYTFLLMVLFPFIINGKMNLIPTIVLVFSISFGQIVQYLFGVTNQLLLNADQKSYISLIISSITIILNTIVSVVLIKFGFSISIVKLVSALVLLLRPLFLLLYVKSNYHVDIKQSESGKKLKQKWDAVAQHIATFVVDKTDIAVLTFFSTLGNVSIYYVYHLVVYALYQGIMVLSTGLQSLYGDMIAKNEIKNLCDTFEYFEWIFHSIITLLFSCTAFLIVPFVKIYTNGINDYDYINIPFAISITLAFAFCSLRSYYGIIIKSKGNFKETQNGAIIEAIINVVLSIILVGKYGLIGVAIATIIAMVYRTIYLIIYINRNIIFRKSYFILKLFVCDFISVLFIYLLTSKLSINSNSYVYWVIDAIKVFLISCFVLIINNIIINNQKIKMIFNKRKKV